MTEIIVASIICLIIGGMFGYHYATLCNYEDYEPSRREIIKAQEEAVNHLKRNDLQRLNS